MENSRTRRVRRVCAPSQRHFHRRIPAAQNVRHPVGIEQLHHHRFQLLHGKIFPVRRGIIQPVGTDVRPYAVRQEGCGASKRQQPPKLGGGNIQHLVADDLHPGAHILQMLFLGSNGIPLPFFAPVQYGNRRVRHDQFRLCPVFKRQKHIGSHEQEQLRVGIPFPQFQNCLVGVARSLPFQFHVGHFNLRERRRRQLHHLQPLFRFGRTFRQFLMGRHVRRNHDQPVKPQGAYRLHGSVNMAGMGRIKGTAINANSFHFVLLPPRQHRLNAAQSLPRSCFSLACSIDFSIACWRKYAFRCSRCCLAAIRRARAPLRTGSALETGVGLRFARPV